MNVCMHVYKYVPLSMWLEKRGNNELLEPSDKWLGWDLKKGPLENRKNPLETTHFRVPANSFRGCTSISEFSEVFPGLEVYQGEEFLGFNLRKFPQNTNMKGFPKHKQLVEGLGYVPGVCWSFLGFEDISTTIILRDFAHEEKGIDRMIWVQQIRKTNRILQSIGYTIPSTPSRKSSFDTLVWWGICPKHNKP